MPCGGRVFDDVFFATYRKHLETYPEGTTKNEVRNALRSIAKRGMITCKRQYAAIGGWRYWWYLVPKPS